MALALVDHNASVLIVASSRDIAAPVLDYLFEQGVAPEPLINGEDLIAMGLRPGPKFGRLLDGVTQLGAIGQGLAEGNPPPGVTAVLQ